MHPAKDGRIKSGHDEKGVFLPLVRSPIRLNRSGSRSRPFPRRNARIGCLGRIDLIGYSSISGL